MAQTHEWMFYEVMWRAWAGREQVPYPVPWWAQQAFRRWSDDFDSGTYESKEAAFASNALYRYWHMVGVKDHRQESLIGQAGEIEPVYDKYSLSFFLHDPATGAVRLPQLPDGGRVEQRLEAPHLPVVLTTFRTADDVEFVQRTFAGTVGASQRDLVVTRVTVGSPTGQQRPSPVGHRPVRPHERPTGGVRDQVVRPVCARRGPLAAGQPRPVRPVAQRLERRASRRARQAALLGRLLGPGRALRGRTARRAHRRAGSR
ncbi:hypothetical protein QF037_001907 [Streptomyces canus]|nr:hypothetical protein [Streptomyces canus]